MNLSYSGMVWVTVPGLKKMKALTQTVEIIKVWKGIISTHSTGILPHKMLGRMPTIMFLRTPVVAIE